MLVVSLLGGGTLDAPTRRGQATPRHTPENFGGQRLPIHNEGRRNSGYKGGYVANRTAYLQTMISLASAAFGVVAALAWNGAITALVKQIFGTGAQIVSLFLYAIIITIIAVIVMVNLGRVAERTAQPKA